MHKPVHKCVLIFRPFGGLIILPALYAIYSNLDFVTFIDHKKQPYILFKYWLHQFTKTYPSSDINVAGFDKSTSQ